MQPLSYNFDTIFTFDPVRNILIPKYNVMINGIFLPKDGVINTATPTGGVNLFGYIGHSVIGTWHDEGKFLDIAGFA